VHEGGRVVQVMLRGEGERRCVLEMEGRALRVLHDWSERGLRIEVEGRPYRFSNELAGQVRAGTPALVVALDVAVGEPVEAGQSLGRLEAMKMEIGFESPVSGVVKELCVRPGQQVAPGELLLVIEPHSDGARIEPVGERIELPLANDPL